MITYEGQNVNARIVVSDSFMAWYRNPPVVWLPAGRRGRRLGSRLFSCGNRGIRDILRAWNILPARRRRPSISSCWRWACRDPLAPAWAALCRPQWGSPICCWNRLMSLGSAPRARCRAVESAWLADRCPWQAKRQYGRRWDYTTIAVPIQKIPRKLGIFCLITRRLKVNGYCNFSTVYSATSATFFLRHSNTTMPMMASRRIVDAM